MTKLQIESMRKLVNELQRILEVCASEEEDTSDNADVEMAKLIARRDAQALSLKEAEEAHEHTKQVVERRRAAFLFWDAKLNSNKE